MEKRYNEELEQLIEIALTDGVLTDKEKEVIFKKAQTLGVDLDELEMDLEARVYKLQREQQLNKVTPPQQSVTPVEEKKPLISEETKAKLKEDVKSKIKEGISKTGDNVKDNATKVIGKAAVSAGMGILSKVLIGLAVAAVLSGLSFGVYKIIEANKLDILDTPNVVSKIRKISELNTYTYVDQVVVKDQVTTQKISKHLIGKGVDTVDVNHEYVYLVTGRVRAGYDFAKIKDGDIKASNDTLWITLPQVEFLDVISNPSDVEAFYEENTEHWAYEELQNKKVEARKIIEQNAIERGVLDRAEKAGKEKIENLFKAFGFNVIEISKQ